MPLVAIYAKYFSLTILTIYVIIVSYKFILISKRLPLRIIDYYTLIDLFLALIPLIIIKNLKIRRKRKITLIAVLSLRIL